MQNQVYASSIVRVSNNEFVNAFFKISEQDGSIVNQGNLYSHTTSSTPLDPTKTYKIKIDSERTHYSNKIPKGDGCLNYMIENGNVRPDPCFGQIGGIHLKDSLTDLIRLLKSGNYQDILNDIFSRN